jgi:uncharacterized membrane protein
MENNKMMNMPYAGENMKAMANMPFHGYGGGGYGGGGYGGGYGYGCGFLIVVVLFILLIIIGATAFHGKDDCDLDESSSSH